MLNQMFTTVVSVVMTYKQTQTFAGVSNVKQKSFINVVSFLRATRSENRFFKQRIYMCIVY